MTTQGAVCTTRRYIDVEPTRPEDYNDMHMQLGGRACVPKGCASGDDLEAVAKLMWKRESQMSSRDFGGNHRKVTVALDMDCSRTGGVSVSCDKHGKPTMKKSRSRLEAADAAEPSERSGAPARNSLAVAVLAAAWALLAQVAC
eukprot:TRINITY_DN2472_c0_g1_i1.p1 TRINITY_DN2472_c0_g1~~TRINITY_DN2472_c0_g1_i1.p1  ORF type:complete len:144 (+),score=38.74 TRINITY_DN2472_c0_g1_i1:550-981(+)